MIDFYDDDFFYYEGFNDEDYDDEYDSEYDEYDDEYDYDDDEDYY